MNTTLGQLMERNVLEVFGERDSARRKSVIDELYAEDCTFFEADGPDHRSRRPQCKGGAHSGRSSWVRLSLGRSGGGEPRPRPITVAVRTEWSRASCDRDGCCGLQAWAHLLSLRLCRQDA